MIRLAATTPPPSSLRLIPSCNDDYSSFRTVIKLQIGDNVRRVPIHRLLERKKLSGTDDNNNKTVNEDDDEDNNKKCVLLYPSISKLRSLTLSYYLEAQQHRSFSPSCKNSGRSNQTGNISNMVEDYDVKFTYLDEEKESIVFSSDMEFADALSYSMDEVACPSPPHQHNHDGSEGNNRDQFSSANGEEESYVLASPKVYTKAAAAPAGLGIKSPSMHDLIDGVPLLILNPKNNLTENDAYNGNSSNKNDDDSFVGSLLTASTDYPLLIPESETKDDNYCEQEDQQDHQEKNLGGEEQHPSGGSIKSGSDNSSAKSRFLRITATITEPPSSYLSSEHSIVSSAYGVSISSNNNAPNPSDVALTKKVEEGLVNSHRHPTFLSPTSLLAPSRIKSPYRCFAIANQSRIKTQLGETATKLHVSKQLKREWKAQSQSEHEHWMEVSKRDETRYKLEMETYQEHLLRKKYNNSNNQKQPQQTTITATNTKVATSTKNSMHHSFPQRKQQLQWLKHVESDMLPKKFKMAFAIEENQSNSQDKPQYFDPTFLHQRHSCDICKISPIMGYRYRAIMSTVPNCLHDENTGERGGRFANFDLCHACYLKHQGGGELVVGIPREIRFERVQYSRDCDFDPSCNQALPKSSLDILQELFNANNNQVNSKNSKSQISSTCKSDDNVDNKYSPPLDVVESIRRSLSDLRKKKKGEDEKDEDPLLLDDDHQENQVEEKDDASAVVVVVAHLKEDFSSSKKNEHDVNQAPTVAVAIDANADAANGDEKERGGEDAFLHTDTAVGVFLNDQQQQQFEDNELNMETAANAPTALAASSNIEGDKREHEEPKLQYHPNTLVSNDNDENVEQKEEDFDDIENNRQQEVKMNKDNENATLVSLDLECNPSMNNDKNEKEIFNLTNFHDDVLGKEFEFSVTPTPTAYIYDTTQTEEVAVGLNKDKVSHEFNSCSIPILTTDEREDEFASFGEMDDNAEDDNNKSDEKEEEHKWSDVKEQMKTNSVSSCSFKSILAVNSHHIMTNDRKENQKESNTEEEDYDEDWDLC